MNREFKPGALVKFRKRNWVILPSTDSEIIIIKPLGGAEEEITGIYIPLQFQAEIPTSTEFPNPTGENLGDFESAKILFNASKLSFRNAAGPFRSLARLSFRPRSYQMLPLIMALKQNPIRLLIADDVGVGKTIEALLIARELLDRGEIKSLAVICLPHLCEQWKEELKNKFSIEAEIIRSSTVAKLERQIQDDRNVHQFFPFQIISIDYIKSERRKQIFTQSCPELVIVDEAHTCAKPSGASIAQQQRYHLLHQISKNANQNLILISATPHSGKQEEFQSLLGLLKPKFENVEISVTTDENRKELANHFVQRRRADVEKWMNEETPFPKRIAEELSYTLSPNYENLFAEVLNFAKGLTKSGEESKFSKRLKYWSALALLRGVISSPAAGVEMLRKKAGNYIDDENFLTDENESNPVLDDDFGNESDTAPTQLIEKLKITDLQSRTLKNLADKFENLKNLRDDKKAQEAYALTLKWLKQGFNPIIFCRYIATANYLGDLLKKELAKDYKNISVEIVTGEIHDEQRKEIIAEMGNSPKRVLIATSCLSEGINLQESFTAILHYDLPWNPNKLEQREGRIDRYGQNSPTVKIMLLYGKNNPIDGVVLKVLIRKAREIRRTTGIAVPFPENSKSILDAVLNAVLLQPEPKISTQQIKLDFGESTDIIAKKELEVTNAYQKAQKRETLSRSIFAQHSIKADEIEADLKETDLAIGNVKTVNDFVVQALKFLGVQVDKLDEGYRVFTTNLPKKLKPLLGSKNEVLISFDSPTPKGFKYLGRNHIFVEQMCQELVNNSIEKTNQHSPSRASVIRTNQVKIKTTLMQFRVRNVISEQNGNHEIVAEEMFLWGFQGDFQKSAFLSYEEANKLLFEISPTQNLTKEEQNYWLEQELENLSEMKIHLEELSKTRAEKLVEAHERFRKVVGGKKFKVVEPVFPMDLMGIYVILPEVNFDGGN